MRDRVAEGHPDLRVEIEIINTKGDKILDAPLAKIGDKGLFTKELETALLDGRIDVAVHSAKDMPTAIPDGLEIIAFTEREDVRDVFVPNPALLGGREPGEGSLTLDEVPQGARVGTSSLRRRSQLLALRPDLDVVDIRGNVETRLRKLVEEEMAGTILAAAGLSRLGRSEVTGFAFTFDEMLPAVGQGALAIEARVDHPRLQELKAALDHRADGAGRLGRARPARDARRRLPGADRRARALGGGRRGRRGQAGARRLRGLAGRRPLRARRARSSCRRPTRARDLPRRRTARSRRRRDPGRDPHAVSPAGPDTPRPADRPLAGRTVVVTRPREQAASLVESLAALGAEVLLAPTIRIEPRLLDDEVAAVLRELATYQLVVFTSANAVRVFAGYLARGTEDGGMPAGPVVAAVGPATAAALEKHGLACHLVPDEYVAEGLLDAFEEQAAPVAGARVLIPCARDARDVLPETLRRRGAAVDVLHIYDTVAAAELAVPAAQVESADYITFTSASTAKRLAALLEPEGAGRPLAERLAGARLCSIGPITSRTLRDLGLPVAIEAREYTAAGLVAAILEDARSR